MAFNYFKDPKSVFAMIFILVFLILLVISSPELWWAALLGLAVYAFIFYIMRNNP